MTQTTTAAGTIAFTPGPFDGAYVVLLNGNPIGQAYRPPFASYGWTVLLTDEVHAAQAGG
jgi:hypothetical protein